MNKIGVLSNPLSRSNKRHLRGVEEFLALHQDVIHLRLENFELLHGLLLEFAAADVDVLVINGGDGTISAVLTEIFEREAFAQPPIIAVLPGGTSNTIARDVGMLGNRVSSLRRLVHIVRTADCQRYVQERPLIRVSYDQEASAVVGMFFGTAGVCDAVSLRRRIFPQSWIPDPLAGGLTLLYVLANVIIGRLERVLTSHEIDVAFDPDAHCPQRYSALIATTLKRIFLGSYPFWGDTRQNLHVTSIRSPASDLVRQAYRLLYGKDKQNLPTSTYRSESVECVELHMQCAFNLDGEFFNPSPNTPVALSSAYTARFLQC
jgi:diacylglycerol kinase (ATP)